MVGREELVSRFGFCIRAAIHVVCPVQLCLQDLIGKDDV